MIRFVTGTLGAGKTFHSVRLAMLHCARGGTVVTNVDCNHARFARMVALKHGVLMSPDQLRVFDPEITPDWEQSIPWGEAEGVVLVIIDEAHLFYNARDWKDTQQRNKRLLSFLTQSRKCGVDVVWITQEGGNVDRQFRVLAEWELAIVNVKHLPLGWLGVFPINCYVVKHISAKAQVVVRRDWYRYETYIKGSYRTDALLNTEMRDLAAKVERIGFVRLPRCPWMSRIKTYMLEEFADWLPSKHSIK
jgi:hypothetical protein